MLPLDHSASATLPAEAAIGYYGKLAEQADYFRLKAGDFARLGLDRWFQEGQELVHAGWVPLPDEPVFFTVAPAGSDRVLAGAFVPSRDAVGRLFPLIGFASLPRSVSALVTLPSSLGEPLDRLADLLLEGRHLAPEAFVARANGMPSLRASLPAVDAHGLLGGEMLAPLGLALGGLPHGAAYALRTLVAACEQARRPGAKTPISIEAPAPTDPTRVLWLELVRRHLRPTPEALPSVFWTRRSSSRLIITLGAPTPAVLDYLARPANESQRYWPLRTDLDPALQAAYAALSPTQRQCLDNPGSSLADVVQAFG